MIKKIKQILIDLRLVRYIRNNLNILKAQEAKNDIRYLIRKYSVDDERLMRQLLTSYLANAMVKGEVSVDEYNGYVMALAHREAIFNTYKSKE